MLFSIDSFTPVIAASCSAVDSISKVSENAYDFITVAPDKVIAACAAAFPDGRALLQNPV